ncbi:MULTISPECIES: 30S ribosomal protein S25e [Acidianus]|uniref:30S ribosomal protein S25 n=1 Tax=Candidatus Acidianus copahuensis TaxID=1160895 RepID=A0A031LMK9_9CREN|nr:MULTISPECIES: 30S ribosomal protein S25e [Acidianus]EZQ03120.1 30S ribosomal protein S25 [Candidatus Acidianus copahuensis]NON63127.1 30S ribosomal protein S25e [Acidianus sp. RZ1]
MGGVSKKPISNIEKKMKKETDAQQQTKGKKKSSKTGSEVISKNVVIGNDMIKRVEEEIKKEKIITPYTLATKANISVSVAKRILKDLNNQGIIKENFKNKRTAVYISVQS